MRAFTRHTFQLRNVSLESKLAYSAFLLMMLPGVASLVAISVGRTGFNAQAIAAYYRGTDDEMSFPKTFWQLVETSHFHLFIIPVVALILSHLLLGTHASRRLRLGLIVSTFSGALLDVSGPWLVRYVSAFMAWLLLVGWVMLGASLFTIVVVTLVSMWGPERWLAPKIDAPGESVS